MKTQAVKLIAMRPFLHGYRVLSVGDGLVTTPGHAKQLILLGHTSEDLAPEPMVAVDVALGETQSGEAVAAGGPPQSESLMIASSGQVVASGGEQSPVLVAAAGGDVVTHGDESPGAGGASDAAGQMQAGLPSGDLLGGGDASVSKAPAEGDDVTDEKGPARQRRRSS